MEGRDLTAVLKQISELEDENRKEDNKFREEQRRHESTKQELDKERKKVEEQANEIYKLAEELTKVGQMKARDEIILKQHEEMAKTAKENLEKLKDERKLEKEEFKKMREKLIVDGQMLNENYRTTLRKLKAIALSKGTAVILDEKPHEDSMDLVRQPCDVSTNQRINELQEKIVQLEASLATRDAERLQIEKEFNEISNYCTKLESDSVTAKSYIDGVIGIVQSCERCAILIQEEDDEDGSSNAMDVTLDDHAADLLPVQ